MPAWFDSFADAIASGEATYLVCERCTAATLPPRRFCPDCGATALARRPLPDHGVVTTFTEISVTIPKFHGTTPYTVVLAELAEAVTLTGQLRAGSGDELALGDEVTIGIESHAEGTPVITFRPRED